MKSVYANLLENMKIFSSKSQDPLEILVFKTVYK